MLHHIVLPLLPRPTDPSSSCIVNLILVGYSAGSLSASVCFPLEDECKGVVLQTRWILLSYPLSVRFALTCFRSSYFIDGLHRILDSCSKSTEESSSGRVLVVYGDGDQFTSIDKYRKWVIELTERSKAVVQSLEIAQSDHFWHGRESKRQMIVGIAAWIAATAG